MKNWVVLQCGLLLQSYRGQWRLSWLLDPLRNDCRRKETGKREYLNSESNWEVGPTLEVPLPAGARSGEERQSYPEAIHNITRSRTKEPRLLSSLAEFRLLSICH